MGSHWGKKVKLYSDSEEETGGQGILMMGVTAPGQGGNRVVPMQVNSNGQLVVAGIPSSTSQTGLLYLTVSGSGYLPFDTYPAAQMNVMNNTGTDIQIAVTSSIIPSSYIVIPTGSAVLIPNITDTVQVTAKRADGSATPVTIYAIFTT